MADHGIVSAPPAKHGLTPEQRSMRARLAAYALHSKVDGAQHTAPARAKFNERFELEVDPDGLLPPHERQRRADLARRAYFTRLALQSSIARQSKRGTAAA